MLSVFGTLCCGQNFGFTFILGEKNKQDAITVGCKTADVKAKWIEAIRLAQYVSWRPGVVINVVVFSCYQW